MNTIAIEIFANAVGMSEKEMFKQMEMGQLLAEDVLPKVAKEYARVARENGALDAAVTKVNSQYQRFLSSLTRLKVALFEGGFGDQAGKTFQMLSQYIYENMDQLKAFGAVIGQVFYTLSRAVGMLFAPLGYLLRVFNSLFGDAGAKVVGVTLAVTGLAMAARAMATAFALANVGFMTLARNIARYGVVTTVFLGAEDIYTGMRNPQADAIFNRIGVRDVVRNNPAIAKSFESSWVEEMFRKALGMQSGRISLDVNINTQGVEGLIETKIDSKDAGTKAALNANFN